MNSYPSANLLIYWSQSSNQIEFGDGSGSRSVGPGGFHNSLAHIYRVWRQKTGPLASVTSPSLKTTTALISKSIRQIGQNQFAGKCVNVEELRLVSGAIPLIQHNLCLGPPVFHASSLIILQFVAVVRLWSRPLIVHWSFPSLLY